MVEHYLDTVGVRGSNPLPRILFPVVAMSYTYGLRCGDGLLYVCSAINLRKRIADHRAGRVPVTSHRLPIVLEYYEACRSEASTRMPEKQLKTGVAGRI